MNGLGLGAGLVGVLCCVVLAQACAHDADVLQQVRKQLLQEQERLHARQEQQRTIQEFTPPYEQLIHSGFIGAGPPDWIESLEQLRLELSAPGFRYHLSSPQATGESAAGLHLYAGRMDIELSLRHEGELLQVLRLLPQRFMALVQTESCSLQRAAGVTLHVQCQLRWYTLQDELSAWHSK